MTKDEALRKLDIEIDAAARYFRSLILKAAVMIGVTTAALVGLLQHGLFIPALVATTAMLSGVFVTLAHQVQDDTRAKRGLRAFIAKSIGSDDDIEIG